MSIRIILKSIWSNPGNRGQRLRRTMSAVGWQVQKRIAAKSRVMELANGRAFAAHGDCVVSSALIYADFPEFEELQFVREVLDSNDVLIDIGANVGHINLLLNDIIRAENIYAFEPTPVTFRRLQHNWSLNKEFGSPNLFQVAVGGEDGQVRIPDVSVPNTMTSVISVENSESCGVPAVSVPMIRLDSVRQSWKGRRIGLLKIDVEGHEDGVFRGALACLKEDRPKLVMFESLQGGLSPVVKGVLANAGFRVFQLSHGRPDFQRDDAQNLFACPLEEMRRYSAKADICVAS